jgi:hypothetical protein
LLLLRGQIENVSIDQLLEFAEMKSLLFGKEFSEDDTFGDFDVTVRRREIVFKFDGRLIL